MTAFFSQGLRPFFFAAGLWAVLAMGLWLATLSGLSVLPVWVDPFAWHGHELLFGYLGAALAGFLLTAAPSWTQQPAPRGGHLALIFTLWLTGRAAMLLWGGAPGVLVAAVDLAFPVVLNVTVLRMIIAVRQWRQLSVLSTTVLFLLGNLTFHMGAVDLGLRLGLVSGLVMVSVMGGRVVPSFTRNWLKSTGRGPAPLVHHCVWCNSGMAIALLVWAMAPEASVTAALLAVGGLAHLWRLVHWRGLATLAEPLVWVLHAAYLFLPLGALATSVAILAGTTPAAALHLWTVGAVGLMTLAIMTRATLGHTGSALVAGFGTALLYGAVILAALARPTADLLDAPGLQTFAGLAWMAGFAGFVGLYGGRHLRPAATSA